MNKTILIFIAVALAGGGIYFSKNNSESAQEMQNESQLMEKEEVLGDAEAMADEGAMMKTGSYAPYSQDKLSLAETGDVVLFFRASWCPTCRTLDKDIRDNLSKIPETLTILDVDYDNSTALKQKYGVTYQHTLVQVDQNGNLIKKWAGSSSLESLLAEVE